MAYLLDTTFIIESVLGKRPISTPILENVRQQRFSISIITLGELYEGAYHRVNPEASIEEIQDRLKDFAVLPVTEAVCRRFGEVRAQLRCQGAKKPDLDLLIAATALEEGLTVITRNLSDFEGIPDLRVASL